MAEATEQRESSIIEQAQQRILDTLGEVNIVQHLPLSSEKRTVGILGAGYAVEVKPLTTYFSANNLGIPRIVAYSLEEGGKVFSERLAQEGEVALDYRIADASDPGAFKGEQYDVIIIRKPNVHTGQENWRRIIRNGLEHLKPSGCILVTTSEDEAYRFVFGELKDDADVVLEYNIPEERRIAPFFNEDRLLLAKKKEQ